MTGTLAVVERNAGSVTESIPPATNDGVSVTRPEPSSIPDEPGAYLFRDSDGRVIYAGKAGSLRKRLASYWGKPLHPRTEAMVQAADPSNGSWHRARSTH